MSVVPITAARGTGRVPERERRRARAVARRDTQRRIDDLSRQRSNVARELASAAAFDDPRLRFDRADEMEARLLAIGAEIRSLRGGQGGAA